MTFQNQSGSRNILLAFFLACFAFSASFGQAIEATDSLDIARLEHEVGQMLMVGIRGTHLNADAMADTRRQIESHAIGGIIFFKHNIKNSRQFRIFVKSIADLSGKTPLFLAVDEEGGKVRRLTIKHGFEEFPSAAHVGSTSDQDQAYQIYTRMAEQIASLGLNLNLAPVVDVNINRTSPAIGQLNRSFSRNPGDVYKYGSSFIQAHHQKNILTTLKHYPGHGSSREDTHNELTDITYTWRSSEQLPFKRLIDSSEVDLIMAGHLFDKNMDERYPASLSRVHIQETLRNKLGFDGVVITDDLQMGAIIKLYDLKEIIISAINAGCDILQFSDPQNLHQDLPAYFQEVVIEAVKDGTIPAARIHESYQRIMKLKQGLSRPQKP
jgi:beta-N-acetylhexosaminidase